MEPATQKIFLENMKLAIDSPELSEEEIEWMGNQPLIYKPFKRQGTDADNV